MTDPARPRRGGAVRRSAPATLHVEGRRLRARLVREGIAVDGRTVPLLCGAVHYWRLSPEAWRPALAAVRRMGLRVVDTYVPWGVHETARGHFDFGVTDPRRDVTAFLRAVREADLLAIVRPGPHINAELTFFGLPERVVWDPACQARGPDGSPVMLPVPPIAFPVPSYASEAFLGEAARWLGAAAREIGPLRWPDGPVAMVQVDNEGAMYFRDGAYDQDWHPDAISAWRAFLRRRYRTEAALRAAHGTAEATFASALPPVRFDARTEDDLARHLDWAELHEELLAGAFGRMARVIAQEGLAELPVVHNLPMGHEATPLDAARIERAIDLTGLDYYHRAGETDRAVIDRRTGELAVRCDARGVPAFACEMGAGFPPYFPPLRPEDSAFTVLCALAYGLRGFNVYMAVDRDRWIGAPIDAAGNARPEAAFWAKLCAALERTRFATLRREVPVRIVVPRTFRRLARAMHALGPATGALLSVLGLGPRECCLEDDLGTGGPVAVETDAFVRAFEEALWRRGVPFAVVGGEWREAALAGARWIVCASPGGMDDDLFDRLRASADAGIPVTIGPRPPERDAAMRGPARGRKRRNTGAIDLLATTDADTVERVVAGRVERLGLPAIATGQDGVFVTVHADESGAARVVFVVNAGKVDVEARVAVPGAGALADAIDGGALGAVDGAISVRIGPRAVRMLEVA